MVCALQLRRSEEEVELLVWETEQALYYYDAFITSTREAVEGCDRVAAEHRSAAQGFQAVLGLLPTDTAGEEGTAPNVVSRIAALGVQPAAMIAMHELKAAQQHEAKAFLLRRKLRRLEGTQEFAKHMWRSIRPL